MSTYLEELPRLDCHAHLAPDVTDQQVRALGNVFVFSVTRSLGEAARVQTSRHPQLIWGCGVHPRLPSAVRSYDEQRFSELVRKFIVVGEIGLDARSEDFDRQTHVLDSILRVIADLPVICSLHSAGAAPEVVALLAKHRPQGAILHWFTGDAELVSTAAGFGCAFSVNAAMTDKQLLALPPDRVLPETDYPLAGRTRAAKPGDVSALEMRLSRLWNESPAMIRARFFQNLRELAIRSGTLDRLPDQLADLVVAA